MEDKQIGTNLTEQSPEWKMRLAYFFADNKVQIKRLFLFSLFFLDVVVVFLFGSILVNYQTGVISDDVYLWQLPANLINDDMIKQNFSPRELVIDKVELVPAGGNRYNVLALIRNDNKEWKINRLEYSFVIGGEEFESRTTFVLPESEKYLMYFNADKSGSVDLKIISTDWQRIDDYSLLSFKDQIEVERAIYTTSRSTKLSGQVEMTIFNDTPYGFWEIGLPIILYNRNSKPIAIDYVVINKLFSKEERQIEVSWHEPIREVISRIEVKPEINLLGQNVIMELESVPGSPPGLE